MSLPRTYIGAFLIAIAGIIFWTFLLPTYDNVMDQRNALTERATLLNDRQAIINKINDMAKEYATRATDITRFTSIIPAKKSAPELVSSIQALATQNGLQLTTITLSGNSNPEANTYQRQPVDLGLSGSYLAFKSFLMALERNIRLIDIVSIDASPTAENSPIIGFQIKGNAYYIK